MESCHSHKLPFKKLVALFSLGILAVIPTLFGSFVFDDSEAILKNAGVVNPSEYSVYPTLFHTDFWGVDIKHPHSHKSYRPLTTLTYRWEYSMWGRNPFPFHLTNIIVHGLNCSLVYLFLYKCLQLSDNLITVTEKKRLRNFEQLAWWSSVIFSVHPVHVEPLGAVVGRADLFAAFLFLLAFVTVPLGNQGISAPFILTVFAIVASLFKENAVVLPIVFILLDVTNVKRLQELFHPKRVLKYCLVVGTIGAFVGWRLWFQGGPPKFQDFDNPPVFAKTWLSKVLSVSYIWALNAFTLLCPVYLCYDWSMGCVRLIKDLEDPRILALAFALFLGAALLMCAIHKRTVLVAIIISVVTFLPSSNLIFIVGFVLAERNLYIPSIGYCLLVAYTFLQVRQKKLLIFVALSFFGRSVQRSTHWIDQRTLFKTGLEVCPNNAKVHYNMGTMYAEDGEVDKAENSYKTALILRSDYHQAMNNLGNLIRDKDPSESEYWLRSAVKLKPDFAAAWMNLGIVLSKTNQQEALECYKTALRHRKVYPDCEYNLGNLFLDMGDPDNALKCWKKATDLKRQHTQAWINIVILLEQKNKLQDAKIVALQALSILKDCDTLHFIVGNILGKLAEYDPAQEHFEEAIRIRATANLPVPPKYYTNLGVLFHRWGNVTLAIQAYKQALRINPAMESAKKNLELLQSKQFKKLPG